MSSLKSCLEKKLSAHGSPAHCAGDARRHKTAYLLAADTLLKSTYHKRQEKGSMHADRWVSNSERVIAATSNSWLAMEQCRRHVRRLTAKASVKTDWYLVG